MHLVNNATIIFVFPSRYSIISLGRFFFFFSLKVSVDETASVPRFFNFQPIEAFEPLPPPAPPSLSLSLSISHARASVIYGIVGIDNIVIAPQSTGYSPRH